jgi:ribonuclease HII
VKPTLDYERRVWSANGLLIGVDEAGRGPLAGPVVAAAVVFPAGCHRTRRVRDSKTLSEPQRDEAAAWITKKSLAVAVAAASVREIDRYNIRRATALAMRRAVDRVAARLGAIYPSIRLSVLIDGLAMPEIGSDHEALVDGDALCFSISAAGIMAKTVRDRLMARLAARYPHYDWLTNRGYATEAHRRAIDEVGPTKHHRKSFTPVAQLGLGL